MSLPGHEPHTHFGPTACPSAGGKRVRLRETVDGVDVVLRTTVIGHEPRVSAYNCGLVAAAVALLAS